MNYVNAADVLPDELLKEIKKFVSGELLYIPSGKEKSAWGEKSGSRQFYRERNRKIKELFQGGKTIEELSESFGLSYETVRKIIQNEQKKRSSV